MDAARSYLGVKWRHLGRDRHGVDCVGLLLCAARDVGMSPPQPDPYARGHRGPQMLAAVRNVGRQVPITERRLGDVLVFRDVRFCAHLGVLSMKYGVEHVINARTDRGKVIEEPMAGEPWAKLAAVIRPPDLES